MTAVGVAMVALWLAPGLVSASCGSGTIEEQFDSADVVLRGRVERAGLSLLRMGSAATLRVKEVWKGPRQARIVLNASWPGLGLVFSSAGQSLQPGTEVLVFGNFSLGLTDNACSGTTEVALVPPEDLASLGPGELPIVTPLDGLHDLPVGWLLVALVFGSPLPVRMAGRRRGEEARSLARLGLRHGAAAGAFAGGATAATYASLYLLPDWYDASLATRATNLAQILATAVAVGAPIGGLVGAAAGRALAVWRLGRGHELRIATVAGAMLGVMALWAVTGGLYWQLVYPLAAVVGAAAARVSARRTVRIWAAID